MALLGVYTELIKAHSGTSKITGSPVNHVLEMLDKYLDAADLKIPASALLSALPDKAEPIKDELKEWNQATDDERWKAYTTFIENFFEENMQAAAIYIWLRHSQPLSISELIKASNYSFDNNDETFAYKLLALWCSSDKNKLDAEQIIGPLIKSLESGEPTLYAGSEEIQRLQAIPQTDQQKAVVIACWWLLSPANNGTKNPEIPLEKIYSLIKNVHMHRLTDNEDLASSVLAKWLRSLDGSIASIETVISFIRNAKKSDTESEIARGIVMWWDYFNPPVSTVAQVLITLNDSEKVHTIERWLFSNPGKSDLSTFLELSNTINGKEEKEEVTLDYFKQEINTITTTEGMQVLKTLNDAARGILVRRWFEKNKGEAHVSTFLDLNNTINDKNRKAALTQDYFKQKVSTATPTEVMQLLITLNSAAIGLKQDIIFGFIRTYLKQYSGEERDKKLIDIMFSGGIRVDVTLKEFKECLEQVGVTVENFCKAIFPEADLAVSKMILDENSRFKDLIGIALELKNKNLLMLILSKFSLSKLKTQSFREYYKEIARIFPEDKKNQDLYLLLDEAAVKSTHDKFDKFDKLGMIDNNDMALILAAKAAEKNADDPNYKNTIFVIEDNEMVQLIEQIKFLINNNTNDIVKFQIIRYNGAHAMFGEFEINKTQPAGPIVRYLHCDSLESTSLIFTKVETIITLKFKTEISPLVQQIEIYNSNTPMQKGLGCTYFALDGALMLATPEDRPYVHNVMQYMRDHKDAQTHKLGEKITLISAPLPPRFIRGSQFTEKLTPYLQSSEPEANVVVNKKNKTALESIQEHLDKSRGITLNLRVTHKMKTYHHKVKQFIQDKKLSSSQVLQLEAPYKIGGLKQFCQNQVTGTQRLITSSFDVQIPSSSEESSKHETVSTIKGKIEKG